MAPLASDAAFVAALRLIAVIAHVDVRVDVHRDYSFAACAERSPGPMEIVVTHLTVGRPGSRLPQIAGATKPAARCCR